MFKLSLKLSYGILAAFDLAIHANEHPVQAKAIAQRQNIPHRFIEQILVALKHAGVVQSHRGSQGGYMLVRDPSEVSVAEIIRALSGPLSPPLSLNGSTNGHAKPSVQQHTLLLDIWNRVQRAEEEVLTSMTLESLVEEYGRHTEQQSLMYHI